jgi:hypothetical protein
VSVLVVQTIQPPTTSLAWFHAVTSISGRRDASHLLRGGTPWRTVANGSEDSFRVARYPTEIAYQTLEFELNLQEGAFDS